MPVHIRHKGQAVRDEVERYIAEHGMFFVIILGVVLVKWLWSETRRSWKDWTRHILVSLFVGTMTYNYLNSIDTIADNLKGPILALAVLQADSIVVGLINIGNRFRDDPVRFGRDVMDIWRGRK